MDRNGKAEYFLVQLTEDLFRREPRNVGVLVLKGDRIAARFVGETVGGEIDKRTTRRYMSNADVYAQWVEYWKRMMHTPDGIKKILANKGGNYTIISGGIVSETDHDSPEKIAEYLYPLLVSHDGLAEALRDREEEVTPESTSIKFKKVVGEEFEQRGIMASSPGELWVPHPIRKDVPVPGKSHTHTPAYMQENGQLYVMEPVDFTTPKKALAKDHAGWAAYMFSDLKAVGKRRVFPVAVIQLKQADMDDPSVIYGMNMLEKNASLIVNWLHEDERESFVRDRVAAARNPS